MSAASVRRFGRALPAGKAFTVLRVNLRSKRVTGTNLQRRSLPSFKSPAGTSASSAGSTQVRRIQTLNHLDTLTPEIVDAARETLLDDWTTTDLEFEWGLVPVWAKDTKGAARLFNARSETVTEKPSFRAAATKRRGLVPADGYYEWQVTGDGKIPRYLHPEDAGQVLSFAALYGFWPDPGVARR